MPGPPRVILDCNALFQAFVSPDGPAAACLALVDQKRILLVTSRDVRAEARGVLNRPFVREKEPTVTPKRIEAFLEQIRYRSLYFREVPLGVVDGCQPERNTEPPSTVRRDDGGE